MGKIYILGNQSTFQRYKSLPEHIEISISDETIENRILSFVKDTFTEDTSVIVIDLDATSSPKSQLMLAIAFRLSITQFHKAVLCPIVFVSEQKISAFYSCRPYSQIFLTTGVHFMNSSEINAQNISYIISNLTPENYKTGFLDIIKIEPAASEGKHSMANQWGADILKRMLTGGAISQTKLDNTNSLYFKYSFAETLTSKNIMDILEERNELICPLNIRRIEASGKKILLIDDEADKGWSEAIGMLMKNADLQIINHQAADFSDFSQEEQQMIRKCDFDLIFLDLRMNGVQEEDITKPNDFSGAKILRAIKQINPGTQVIMFTASNKAWNMQALLEGEFGADGYYIKESPEYHFPLKESEANTAEFIKCIKGCLDRSYLKDLHKRISNIKSHIWKEIEDGLGNMVCTQIDIAYAMLTKAVTPKEFAYAYIALEQTIEVLTSELCEIRNNKWKIVDGEYCENFKIDINNQKAIADRSNYDVNKYGQWRKITSIYHQLAMGTDETFGADIKELIEYRNQFMHADKKGRSSKIEHSQTFIRIFDRLYDLLMML